MRLSIARPFPRLPRKLGAFAATLVLALAAGVATTAFAQRGPWGHDGPAGMGPGMEMHGGWAARRMLDLVDATPAQRTQIQQIMQAAHTDLQALRASGQSLRQQGQALFTQPSIDANAAEALRQQELVLHDQVTKRMLQARLDAANVLTPAQRQTLATAMATRRALMQKQRAERAALNHGPQ